MPNNEELYDQFFCYFMYFEFKKLKKQLRALERLDNIPFMSSMRDMVGPVPLWEPSYVVFRGPDPEVQ